MHSFDSTVGPAMLTVFDATSELVTFRPKSGAVSTVPVILRTDVEVRDRYDTVIEMRTEVQFLRRDVLAPMRGDVIEKGGLTFRLLEVIAEDFVSSKWVAAPFNE